MDDKTKAWVIVQDGYEHTEVHAVVRGSLHRAKLIAENYPANGIDSGAAAYPVELPFFDYTKEAT